ncbi:MAG TPA: hypothetical protein VER37_08180, partial [Thermomicrobiales bacterium]|nr:hypothetical protein [Thermomicrobiales bacterium]
GVSLLLRQVVSVSERRGVVRRGEWQKRGNGTPATASANHRAYGSPRDRETRGTKAIGRIGRRPPGR